MNPDLPFAPATSIADAVASGERSAVDVTEAYLDRIDDRNDDLNAYLTVTAESAREAARAADEAVAAGDDLGPLHGVPVALKDLTAFKAGVRHTFGCRALSDNVADHTSEFVRRLEEAGAVVLGKTNTPEFGHRPTTDNLLAGPTRNPFDRDCNAGGSSGGSAAAVADGLTALGQGGDAIGSVRIPAALCGVFGFKPSFGRIPDAPRPNAFQNHTPFVDKGVLTRTVADGALMLDVMAGPDPRDPFSLPAPESSFLAATERSTDGLDLDIGYSPDLGVFAVEDAVRSTVGDALGAFESLGASVDRVDVEFGRSLGELRDGVRDPEMSVFSAKVASALSDRTDGDFVEVYASDIPEPFRERVRRGRAYSAVEYAESDRLRTEVFDAVVDVFEAYDLLVTPTVAVASVPNGVVGPETVAGRATNPFTDWQLTWPFNFTGHPAASVPAGFVDGMPVGMQVVAPRHDDAAVLAASAAFERERPWAAEYPGR